MSRYIDADNLKKSVGSWLELDKYYHPYSKGVNIPTSEVIDLIETEPTADVTKVICCKDCFYAKPYNAKWQLPIKEDALWCTHHEEEKTQGWFCADAIERMVEE